MRCVTWLLLVLVAAEWFNRVLKRMWPQVHQALKRSLMRSLTPVFDRHRPVFVPFLSFDVRHLGADPPVITGDIHRHPWAGHVHTACLPSCIVWHDAAGVYREHNSDHATFDVDISFVGMYLPVRLRRRSVDALWCHLTVLSRSDRR